MVNVFKDLMQLNMLRWISVHSSGSSPSGLLVPENHRLCHAGKDTSAVAGGDFLISDSNLALPVRISGTPLCKGVW